MKYLHLFLERILVAVVVFMVLVLFVASGCSHPVINDTNKMGVVSVESCLIDKEQAYTYIVATNTGGSIVVSGDSIPEHGFIIYSKTFYPVGTDVIIQFLGVPATEYEKAMPAIEHSHQKNKQ